MKNFIFLFCLLLLYACGDASTSKQAPTPEPEPLSEAEENDLLFRLSAELTPNPTTQLEIDRNLIINYAIDHELPLTAAPEGYYYIVLEPGQGELLQWGDRVQVIYTGRLLDGQVFDRADNDDPFTAHIGNLIPAWNQGLQRLRPGGRLRLLAPSHLAYGPDGLSTPKGQIIIPPNAVLDFELEVVAKK